MVQDLDEKVNELAELIRSKKLAPARKLMEDMMPADIAALFDELGEEECLIAFRILPKELAADTFVYFDNDIQETLIKAFNDAELKEVMDQVFLDDTVDIIEEMPANVVKRILRSSRPEMRAMINEILKYPEDSAGSIMTIEYIALRKDITVREAFEKIRKTGMNKETIYTCYIVDQNRYLDGLVSVRDLLNNPYETKLEDIMETNVISVNTHDDKEAVAQILSKYDFLALPVVDHKNRQ